VAAGRATAEEVRDRERGPGALLSWEEVESLSSAGLFDFQSHTLTHARIHCGPRLASFVTPWSRRGYDAFDQPLIREGDRDLLGEEVPLGTPVLESAPRTSETLRFLEDGETRAACREAVGEEGEDFFRRDDWESVLRSRAARHPVRGRVETAEEQARAIERELVESRRLIQERTGRPVRHLCYPWHAFGPTATRLAVEAGYLGIFCGKVPGVPITRPGGDLRQIARLGEDYIELLPGQGRTTLGRVLRRKWSRRFGGGGRTDA
jgi:hypothetical protein